MAFPNARTLQFSPNAFRELSDRLPQAQAQAQQTPPQQSYCRTQDVEWATIRERARMYGEETPRERLFRYGQWVALVLSVAFIATIVVMMAILSVRVSAAFDNIDGDDTSAKVSTVMDLAVEGAANARLATQNVLRVTESARLAASVAAPQLVHAVNETSELVDHLRSWSFHPSLQIAPGHVNG